MFDSKFDVSKLISTGRSPAGYKVFFVPEHDITILDDGRHQRIYFERYSNYDNYPCRFNKCQHFGSERFQNGWIETLRYKE